MLRRDNSAAERKRFTKKINKTWTATDSSAASISTNHDRGNIVSVALVPGLYRRKKIEAIASMKPTLTALRLRVLCPSEHYTRCLLPRDEGGPGYRY